MAAKRTSSQRQHGRQANQPTQIPARGWWDILWRIKDAMANDHVMLVAAGVAFYGMLAIVPTIVATISLWALLFDPQQIAAQIEEISHLLPEEASGIIVEQAQQASEDAATGMSLAAIGGILFAIYSASRGTRSLMEGLNIIYDEEEKRGVVKKTLVMLGLTLGAIIMTIVALGTITVIPMLVEMLGLDNLLGTLINLARWPLLMVIVMVALAVLYRYAPSRDEPRWQWTGTGSIIAVVIWLAGSIGFSIYVRNFADYNETYGSLGAVLILQMWFWLSAFIVLMGAELNSEMERQTRHDTTKGEKRPMGEREAHAADTLGEAKE
ncbi:MULTISPECIES: YihY/virulence factor BrkB family protein [Halomonadaceae]|uniref:YihY/virulence factor BrkB family protein n=1 Tax=Halomonadaceae TaxID=28256 RepID=UPI00159AE167|nr:MULTISPECIES: YihY/virulence factor BrkB family protein [Halomonas]QJQ96205.1 YihY/virulence factor BrkB family protein [Halomonas sp. PA5]